MTALTSARWRRSGVSKMDDLRTLLSKAQEHSLSGAVQTRVLEERKRAIDACERQKALLWRTGYGRVAPWVAAESGWEPTDTKAVKCVADWLELRPGKHLVLRGGVGVGKSVAACVAVKAWTEPDIRETPEGPTVVEHWQDVAWLRPDQVVSAVLHAYDDAAPKLRPKMVIDDLGLETKPGFIEAMCELLDRSGHTLLITTNMTKAQMRERYVDQRLLDRLRHTAMAIDIVGKSMRNQSTDF